jgi:hypothetical protein
MQLQVNYQNAIEEIMRYDDAIKSKFQKYFETLPEMPICWADIFPFL